MSELVETTGDGTEVILNTPSISKSQRLNQYKKLRFTFNNYTNGDVETILAKFNEVAEKWCFQEEIGAENHVPHLQGAVVFKKRLRWTELSLPAQIHWDKMDYEKEAFEYCSKTETRKPDGKIWTKNFTVKKPLLIINQLKLWQAKAESILLSEPDGRTIWWIWEWYGHTGKSAFAKYCAATHNTLVIQGGELKDIINILYNRDMDETTSIIIDIPKKKRAKVSYTAIECILNGMITNTKFETGVKMFNPPIVMVFCNCPPVYEHNLSKDRWKIFHIEEDNLIEQTFKEVKNWLEPPLDSDEE